ncbi:MAG TPA: zf-HC2 domain-containing protein [Gemmatimonadota bacterium]|nr:zf-HC2 domain-containing protein [Gemmatimonadota bacterium]
MNPPAVPGPCRAFLDDFSAFVDGHVSPARRAEIQAHVDCCQRCLDHLTAYRRGVTVLRSIEAGAPGDFWERLERRIWPEDGLAVVNGGGAERRRVGRWPGPAVGLAAAAVLALFVFVRGFGPDATPRALGPQRIQASVVMTVPEVPDERGVLALADARDQSAGDSSSRPRAVAETESEYGEAADPGDPAEAAMARVDSRATTGFDSEIRRLRERVFEGSLGRDRTPSSLAMEGWMERDGWVEPVRLGGDWSRTPVRRVPLVRTASAIMPAPWNVDQAVSLP